jgi:hypothetical protein
MYKYMHTNSALGNLCIYIYVYIYVYIYKYIYIYIHIYKGSGAGIRGQAYVGEGKVL